MKRLHFYLTFGLFLGLLLAFGLIRVNIPQNDFFWQQATLDGPFRLFDPKTHQAEYEHLRTYIQTQRKKLGQDFAAEDTFQKIHILSEARHFLRQTLFEELVPFWLDTEWDYNGITEMPRQGTIACGYFVSTLLLHLGFSFDKYRLSRMPSSEMIKQLCHLPSIKTIYKNDFQALLQHLHQQEDGIFLIGLDKHVGLAFKHHSRLRFVHARKPRHVGVIDEPLEQSSTLQHSSVYVVGNLLANQALIENWLLNR